MICDFLIRISQISHIIYAIFLFLYSHNELYNLSFHLYDNSIRSYQISCNLIIHDPHKNPHDQLTSIISGKSRL